MLVHDCIPCQHGRHDRHTEIVRGAIPGLIGSGQECHCRGECVERHRPPVLPMPRRGDHKPDPPPCALCNGDGDICNPGNSDPARKVSDWLPPVGCPRCGESGKDPNP